jgi:hypothetical protein
MQSRNGFLTFLIEITVLVFCWAILSVATQFCLLADIFGNNSFFTLTDAAATYMMHVILVRMAFRIILAQIFPQNNTIYVGLPQMTRANMRELVIIVVTAALIVAFF